MSSGSQFSLRAWTEFGTNTRAVVPWRQAPAHCGSAAVAADVDAFNLLLEMKLKRRRERPNLPRTVTQLVAEDGSKVYVVGTAHFSDDSKRDVVKVSTMHVSACPPGTQSRATRQELCSRYF